MTLLEALERTGEAPVYYAHETSAEYQTQKHSLRFNFRARAKPSHPWTPGVVHAYTTLRFVFSTQYTDDVTACDELMMEDSDHYERHIDAPVTCMRCIGYLLTRNDQ